MKNAEIEWKCALRHLTSGKLVRGMENYLRNGILKRSAIRFVAHLPPKNRLDGRKHLLFVCRPETKLKAMMSLFAAFI